MPTMTARRAGPSRPASDAPHAARLARLRASLAAQGFDGALVSNPKDVGYLTGFTGGDSYLFVPTSARRRPTIISDFRYAEELAPIRRAVEIVIRSRGMVDAASALLLGVGVKRCVLQGDHLTVSEFEAYRKAVGARRLVARHALLATLRRTKDDDEIARIREAVRIQEAALIATLPTIEAGQTEEQIAARLEFEMKSRGSVQPGFVSIVAAQANGSLPHYRPGPVKLLKNSPLLIDWGAEFAGYHADMTRTFAVGRWPAKIREIYSIVLEAHERAADALRPGRTGAAVDGVARRIITEAGYGKQFGHGLGHGLGLDVHELPRLSHMVATTPLLPGDVVTIEPGIYLPGVGGVRIEDDYLVTADGAVRLTTLPRSIEWATLG